MPFSFPKRLFFHNLSATYSFGRRIKGRAADFISATRPMTEEDGAAYRYNILSIYFTDGAVLHTAVALAEDGTLIRLESTHGPQVDDQEVLGHMLYILRHMEREDKGSVPDGTAALWSTSHNDGPRKEPACSRSCRLHRHWELWALMGAASSIDRGGETNVLAMDRAGPVRPV